MIIYAFTKAIPLGFMVLAYLIIMEDKTRNLENQIRAGIEEDSYHSTNKFKIPSTTADKFITYKDCIIEKHKNKYYIMKPSGNILEETYTNIKDAKVEIDLIAPFLPVKKYKRRTVNNIRFVK